MKPSNHVITVILAVFLTTLLNGCVSVSPPESTTQAEDRSGLQFGQDANSIRADHSAILLPNDWELIKHDRNGAQWRNPDYEHLYGMHIPFHGTKSVSYEDDLLISEQDQFYGKVDFTFGEDGTFREQLVFEYNYGVQLNPSGIAGWSVIYWGSTGSKVISLEKAVVILESWGIAFP